MNNDQEYIVLVDEEGNFVPMAFITPRNTAGEYRKEDYAAKNKDSKFAVVKFVEQVSKEYDSQR